MDSIAIRATVDASHGITKHALSLSKALYAFAGHSGGLEHIIIELATEITELGRICDQLHAELTQLVKQKDGHLSTEDERLWHCLDGQLGHSDQTLHSLDTKIDRSSHPGTNDPGLPQIRLNMTKGHISDIKYSIQSDHTGLQMTLQAVNIKVAHLAPQKAGRELLLKIDALQKSIERQDAGQKQRDLVGLMEGVVSSGASLYAASTSNASVAGGRHDANKHNQIADWIRDLERMQLEPKPLIETASDSPLPSSKSINDDGVTTITDLSTISGSLTMFDHLALSDTEDDLAIEVAQQALESGRTAFASEDWHEADALLKEALSLIQALPMKQRATHDTYDLRYMLAVCAFHMQEPTKAEEGLLSFVQVSPSSDDQRLKLCHAGHLLTQTYVRVGKLDPARGTCESTLRGRRSLLGREHADCYESLALLARVYELQGRLTQGKVYLKLIPDDVRDEASAKFQHLTVSHDETLPESVHRIDTVIEEDYSGLVSDPAIQSDKLSQSRGPKDAQPVIGNTSSSGGHVQRSISANAPEPLFSASLRDPIGSGFPVQRSVSANAPEFTERSRDAFDDGLMVQRNTSQNAPQALAPVVSHSSGGSGSSLQRSTSTAAPEAFMHSPGFTNTGGSVQRSDSERAPEPLRPFNPLQAPPTRPAPVPRLPPDDKSSRKDWVRELDIPVSGSLCKAIIANNTSEIRRLRESSINDLSAGVSALHLACLFGDMETVQRLGNSTIQVNRACTVYVNLRRSQDKATPLHFAIAARHNDIIRYLVSKGASLKGNLGVLASKASAPPAYLLWNNWLDVTQCTGGQEVISTLKTLLELGFAIDRSLYYSGYTMLHYAAYLSQDRVQMREEVVKFLLEIGASVATYTDSDKTPLHTAATSNTTPETIRLLLPAVNDAGLLNAVDSSGDTALHCAIRTRFLNPGTNLDVITTLCEAGANVAIRNKERHSAIGIAEFYKDQDAARLLLQYLRDDQSLSSLSSLRRLSTFGQHRRQQVTNLASQARERSRSMPTLNLNFARRGSNAERRGLLTASTKPSSVQLDALPELPDQNEVYEAPADREAAELG